MLSQPLGVFGVACLEVVYHLLGLLVALTDSKWATYRMRQRSLSVLTRLPLLTRDSESLRTDF